MSRNSTIRKMNTGRNAVIYARYSSHNQKDASIEQQVEACMKKAAAENLDVIDIYPDRAKSGKTDKRPNFQKMMLASESGRFQYVIAWKSNRMGRNMLQAMINAEILRERGIKCVYVEEDFADTAAGRFALRNMMSVNQFYSENMAEDIQRGMLDNAKQCRANGSPPYVSPKGPPPVKGTTWCEEYSIIPATSSRLSRAARSAARVSGSSRQSS